MDLKIKKINSSGYNFSYCGEASAKQYLFLIDKKKHLANLTKLSRRNKIISDDYINQKERDTYDNIYEKDEFEDDIFDKNYRNKYKQLLEEQKQKYFNLKKSCSFLSRKEEKLLNEDENKKKNSKRQLLTKFEKDKFKYHLIHHHHDFYMDKSIYNIGGEPACTSYNPQKERIYKKIIYSPEFKKMSGRYDIEELKEKIEQQIENNLRIKKENESLSYRKKIERIRATTQIMKKDEIKPKKDENQNKRNNSKRNYSSSEQKGDTNMVTSTIDKDSFDNVMGKNLAEKISRNNINSRLFKKASTMIVNFENPTMYFLGKSRNDINVQNLYEDEKGSNNDYGDKKKSSENIDGSNTLSSVHQNKTTSVIKVSSSENCNNNNGTDIIYPYNASKNDSNILIDNNYVQQQQKEDSNYSSYVKIDFYPLNKRPIKKRNSTIIKPNKNIFPSIKENKSVNFDKMLSRDYVTKIHEQKYTIYSSLSPNYDSIRPNNIMKVIYARKHYRKHNAKEFKSVFNEFVFDINKNFNKYNNHSPPKHFFIDKISGRVLDNNSPLPSYMICQNNRNAFNTFNEKSLKMNNFANGSLKALKSSFNDKKSFNYRLNDQYYNIGSENDHMKNVMRKIYRNASDYNKVMNPEENKSISSNTFNNTKYKNKLNTNGELSDYYKINLDKLGKYPHSNGEKIDGFTLKTIKNNKSAIELLNDYEKNLFLSKLD